MTGEDLIPMVVCTGMFATIFGIVYIKGRENLAMIERGMNPRQNAGSPKPFISLKYGLLLCGAGLGLLLAFLADRVMLNHMAVTPGGVPYEKEFPQIYFALIAIFGGLGLMLSFLVEKKYWLDKEKAE